ncbi:MAG: alpha/beta hydrolase-fold protein [Planctomycetaceae bacterium]
MPDGDDSWYIDAPLLKEDRYESYLAELIELVSEHYPLSQKPAQRAIGGWSMGGYGAMHYLVNHPDQFSSIVTLIGLLDFPRSGLPEGQSYPVPEQRFGSDEEHWKSFNSLYKATELREKSIYLITGDSAFDRTMNENFSRRLNELEIKHQYDVLEGGHTFTVVRAGVQRLVPFLNKHFAAQEPQ